MVRSEQYLPLIAVSLNKNNDPVDLFIHQPPINNNKNKETSMKRKHIGSSLLACAVLISASVQANEAREAVYSLAQGCYAIPVPRKQQLPEEVP